MNERAESWSTQQLTEFLALVCSAPDAAAATRVAVERAAEVFGAEVEVLDADVIAVVSDVPVRLRVTRPGGAELTPGEQALVCGMEHALGVTLRMLHRQLLLERLSALQRMIVRRAERREVLRAVVDGAAELVGGDVVSLRLLDREQPGAAVLMASVGLDAQVRAETERMPAGDGLGGRAVAEDRLVVSDAPAAMAAPVREEGRVVGSIVVASRRAGRRYGAGDQEVLLAFAEHASLALTDARMVQSALHQAFHDPLTDLPNRALFLDRLELGLSRIQRSKSKLAVLFLDVDRFKIVNDSLGHAAGDQLLREIAVRLLASIRPGDTAARLGGDEFAILLEDVEGREAAEHVALRILRSLRAPMSVAGRDVFMSASIGIAMDADSAGDMIRDADLAMYRAKSEGKGRHAVFEPSMHVAVVERANLEADLQRVIERDQLVLHYQPIVALGNRAIIGVEALVRWRHPTRGLVAPLAFIPLAEETQLMGDLGRWILTEGCRAVAAWCSVRPLRLSVNLSASQLDAAGTLAGDVAAALDQSGLPPAALVLEITETALMHDVAESIACLQSLKQLGVQLAVDDFGTGYSSLDYLRRLPIDILKIDKVFVDDLGAGDATLAQAIIDLGESLDLQVVAEGVEHESQRQRLLELGCSHGQGFHFAGPMSAADVGALLTPAGAATG